MSSHAVRVTRSSNLREASFAQSFKHLRRPFPRLWSDLHRLLYPDASTDSVSVLRAAMGFVPRRLRDRSCTDVPEERFSRLKYFQLFQVIVAVFIVCNICTNLGALVVSNSFRAADHVVHCPDPWFGESQQQEVKDKTCSDFCAEPLYRYPFCIDAGDEAPERLCCNFRHGKNVLRTMLLICASFANGISLFRLVSQANLSGVWKMDALAQALIALALVLLARSDEKDLDDGNVQFKSDEWCRNTEATGPLNPWFHKNLECSDFPLAEVMQGYLLISAAMCCLSALGVANIWAHKMPRTGNGVSRSDARVREASASVVPSSSSSAMHRTRMRRVDPPSR